MRTINTSKGRTPEVLASCSYTAIIRAFLAGEIDIVEVSREGESYQQFTERITDYGETKGRT